jgi:hypothetical protein
MCYEEGEVNWVQPFRSDDVKGFFYFLNLFERRIPMNTKKLLLFLLAMACFTLPSFVFGAVSDFEDLALSPESFYNGSDGAGGFSSGGTLFNNNYNADFDAWDGFAYSNVTDNQTPGYGNQYSAITGLGVKGTSNYAVGYVGSTEPPTITFPEPTVVSGLYVTNTTYAYFTMLLGDPFAKKFGGETGNEPDWFLLTITGRDGQGNAVGTVEFYLADYRFQDNSKDYIVNQWEWVDLGALGQVKTLTFALSSSDVGDFGMNTPAYFAIDSVNAPEPFSIRANGATGVLSVTRGTSVSVTVHADNPRLAGATPEWWIVAQTPFDEPLTWFSLVSPGHWEPTIGPLDPAFLFFYSFLPSWQVFNGTLPPGVYTFYFAVDEKQDGIPDLKWWDFVEVRVR